MMVNQERSPGFIAVTCGCGRGLRAKFEQVGTEIRCWDCHQMVLVPFPRQGQHVARELSDVALVVIKGPGMNSVLAVAVMVTAALAIPYYGAWCSILALALGASAYGGIIRRVTRRRTDDPEPNWREAFLPRSVPRGILCLLMAAGTVVPLWILNGGVHQAPHFNWLGLAIAGLAWTVLPLLMMAVYGEKEAGGSLGLGGCLKLLARHPFATLLALAVIPMTLVLFEAALALILYIPGNLPFFALEFMPMPTKPEPPLVADGIPFYQLADFRTLPTSMFIGGYFDGLRHGYSFVGAIPPSLSTATHAELNPWSIGLTHSIYFLIRAMITTVVLSGLVAAFAIQAQWLASIPSLERKRPA
jgi:hypothetical protein